MLKVLITAIAETANYLKGVQWIGWYTLEIYFHSGEIKIFNNRKIDQVWDLTTFLVFQFEVDISLGTQGIFEFYTS